MECMIFLVSLSSELCIDTVSVFVGSFCAWASHQFVSELWQSGSHPFFQGTFVAGFSSSLASNVFSLMAGLKLVGAFFFTD